MPMCERWDTLVEVDGLRLLTVEGALMDAMTSGIEAVKLQTQPVQTPFGVPKVPRLAMCDWLRFGRFFQMATAGRSVW